MPDDYDYARLGELLADPSAWTDDEESFMRRLRVTQRDLVEAAHPLDVRGRERLSGLVASIDRAIAQREAPTR